MKERMARYFSPKWKKNLSKTRKWLVVGLVLTLIAAALSAQHSFYDTGDWGGTGVVYGYPFPFLSVIGKHYWISNENTVSRNVYAIHFMINLLFYTGSSYLVAKTAIFIDTHIHLTKVQKVGVVLITPYVFLQAIGFITTPFANATYRQILGLRLYYAIQEVYSWYYDYLHRIEFTKHILTQSMNVGVIIFTVGTIHALLRKNIFKTTPNR